jgi:hypothetical protein
MMAGPLAAEDRVALHHLDLLSPTCARHSSTVRLPLLLEAEFDDGGDDASPRNSPRWRRTWPVGDFVTVADFAGVVAKMARSASPSGTRRCACCCTTISADAAGASRPTVR